MAGQATAACVAGDHYWRGRRLLLVWQATDTGVAGDLCWRGR